MKKALIAFTAVVYTMILMVALWLCGGNLESTVTDTAFEVWLVMLLVCVAFAIINFVVAVIIFRKNSKSDNTKVIRIVRIVKLLLIPYFIINLILWVIVVVPLMLFTWFLIPIAVIYTYMVMFITSFYAILKIADLIKRGKLSAGKGILMIILQLTFVLDIFSIIYLARLEKKVESEAENLIPQQIP